MSKDFWIYLSIKINNLLAHLLHQSLLLSLICWSIQMLNKLLLSFFFHICTQMDFARIIWHPHSLLIQLCICNCSQGMHYSVNIQTIIILPPVQHSVRNTKDSRNKSEKGWTSAKKMELCEQKIKYSLAIIMDSGCFVFIIYLAIVTRGVFLITVRS